MYVTPMRVCIVMELTAFYISDIGKFEQTIRLFIRLQQSEAAAVITQRGREGRMPGFDSRACWSQFLHTAKRILAYPQSVQFLLLANEYWPELFDGPAVSWVPSSDPIPKPFRSRNTSPKADGIIGRMTGDEGEIRVYKDFVGTLQAFALDDRIKIQYSRECSTTVHSEIVLLDWLQNHGGIDSSRFFDGWKYIGSSKPTCKLCHYYFIDHQSGVEHRQSHGNLYPAWRFPDVLPSHGQSALRVRHNERQDPGKSAQRCI